jgi:hypothetical protein
MDHYEILRQIALPVRTPGIDADAYTVPAAARCAG